ncbi:uncharacterized protein LOC121507751 [Cheilinus undulatus]|uniref:uncharacterized protein LOC121507751 n=1 Tax=Cheilinus undulatus TaxID=241271 RepID=UPI001BD242F6|nr:uncharacterized protein LOC121507751 [Cheilinus undulatus]
MDGVLVFLTVLQGVVSLNHGGISGSTLEVTVKPGDNITLYCDCKIPTGVYIMWYRNCSHENQPPLVLELVPDKRTQSIDAWDYLSPLPRFHFVKNQSSGSYDLLIENITDSDEGLYYCGTKENKVQEDEKIMATTVYRYSNMTTRVHCGNNDMAWLQIIRIILTVVFLGQDHVSGSTSEVIVTPGDNITLYCDCKLSAGVFIVWYRNCSHTNQPSLILRTRYDVHLDPNTKDFLTPFPYFHLLLNQSSGSYDLLITNISDSAEGVYYCGTEEINPEEKTNGTSRYVYEYGNTILRVQLNSSSSSKRQNVSWMMTIAPAVTVLSSFLSFVVVYCMYQKIEEEPSHQQRRNNGDQITWSQDEDLFLTRVVFTSKEEDTPES